MVIISAKKNVKAMKQKSISKRPNIFERWTFAVPILCYLTFFSMIWVLSVPLKSNTKLDIMSNDINMYSKQKYVDTFEIKMKNSNFNSDKAEAENQLFNDKGEYMVNLNNNNGNAIHIDPTAVLEEVFKNYRAAFLGGCYPPRKKEFFVTSLQHFSIRADKNRSGKLDSKELSEWIRMKILEHITGAISNNYALFTLIDVSPKDDVISWKEYHNYFLRKRGFSNKYVNNHDEKRHKGLQRSIKEQIMRDKASWMEAAKSDPDALTVEEFLAFTHPESSAANHLALVDELYDKFDRDGDELLTEDEFAVLQTQGGEDEMVVIRQDENERRAEFRKSVDLNGDGKADRRELLHYVAPQSPRHSEHEAEALLALADNDHDNMLSLDEVLAHPDLFLKSKMVDTAQSFHDEF